MVVKGELVLFDDPQLVRLEERIAKHRTNTINEILETGKLLAMAHEVLAEKGKNGKFGVWVEERCGISRTQANRYMKAHELFGAYEGIRGHISLSAIEYLAGDVPEEAPVKVVKEAKKGRIIWLSQAKAIVKEFFAKKCEIVSADATTTSENAPGSVHLDIASNDGSETEESAPSDWVEEAAAEEPEEEPTIEEIVGEHNRLIEVHCRAVRKIAKQRPDVQWLDHKGRWDGYIRKIGQALDTLRSAKAVICPKCDGEGCKECQQHGYLPKIDGEGLG